MLNGLVQGRRISAGRQHKNPGFSQFSPADTLATDAPQHGYITCLKNNPPSSHPSVNSLSANYPHVNHPPASQPPGYLTVGDGDKSSGNCSTNSVQTQTIVSLQSKNLNNNISEKCGCPSKVCFLPDCRAIDRKRLNFITYFADSNELVCNFPGSCHPPPCAAPREKCGPKPVCNFPGSCHPPPCAAPREKCGPKPVCNFPGSCHPPPCAAPREKCGPKLVCTCKSKVIPETGAGRMASTHAPRVPSPLTRPSLAINRTPSALSRTPSATSRKSSPVPSKMPSPIMLSPEIEQPHYPRPSTSPLSRTNSSPVIYQHTSPRPSPYSYPTSSESGYAYSDGDNTGFSSQPTTSEADELGLTRKEDPNFTQQMEQSTMCIQHQIEQQGCCVPAYDLSNAEENTYMGGNPQMNYSLLNCEEADEHGLMTISSQVSMFQKEKYRQFRREYIKKWGIKISPPDGCEWIYKEQDDCRTEKVNRNLKVTRISVATKDCCNCPCAGKPEIQNRACKRYRRSAIAEICQSPCSCIRFNQCCPSPCADRARPWHTPRVDTYRKCCSPKVRSPCWKPCSPVFTCTSRSPCRAYKTCID
ncbi:uncharacterized protein LOC131935823 [Physella acuta]|uniref:uncharacterized protein LOC131935823 n=1 Tax=Physella acuta TaxID=109671 RepID=UPI0027DAE133|nr:uncharacterized protein LOC131935823 [Physella acuta]